MSADALAGRRGFELRAGVLLGIVVGLTLVWALSTVGAEGIDQPQVAAVFATAVALGEIVRVSLPGDRQAAPMGTAAALAYALLTSYGQHTAVHSVPQTLVVVTAGLLVGTIPMVIARRPPRLEELTRQLAVVAVVAALVHLFWDLGDGWLEHRAARVQALVLVAIAALGWIADLLLASLLRADRTRAPYLRTLNDEWLATGGLGAAVAATAVLMALAADAMAWWAVVAFGIPLLLAQLAVRRYAIIRQTYLQTIRSLSRVTEFGGYTETGHSRRVSELAVAVGRELGMSEQALLDLEYAALLHDIGQLSLGEPIPGGATVMATRADRTAIASQGGGVIRETGVLDRVALIVERQSDDYRAPREAADPTLPLGSRIIRAVNDYDDLLPSGADVDRRTDAIERLKVGMGLEYDPEVLEALTAILRRDPR